MSNFTFQDSFNDSVFQQVSNELKNRVKIFCIILSTPKNKHTRAEAQKKTWLKRCNGYVYASSKNDPSLPSIKASKNDGYRNAYVKIKNGIIWAWEKYGKMYDYYMKVDDDSYVIMENLRTFLLKKNPDSHGYYGFKLKSQLHNGEIFDYIQGGSGYVLSRRTVALLYNKGFNNKKFCTQGLKKIDDTEIGVCMKNLGIKPHNSIDIKRKNLFSPANPSQITSPEADASTMRFVRYTNKRYSPGMETLSDVPIAFHYVDYNMMFALEYLLYNAEIVGKSARVLRTFDYDNVNTNIKVEKRMKLIEEFSARNYL
uniref:N-acetylgalactosaminide beta-1,3-galactosyltransferase n=1 Tax=Parastrongyloides trichosuri TaxID=131310 RepID=A0A0N4ZZF8_PARTI